MQHAVAGLEGNGTAGGVTQTSGWLAALSDQLLSGLLVCGYPILGLIQFISAIGVPLPGDGAAALAELLSAQGRMSWTGAGVIVVVGSVLGDIVAYALGFLIDWEFLERHGRWFGYTAARGDRVQ